MSDAPAPRYSNLQLRIMSAVVLAALVLSVTWFGGVAFAALMSVMAAAILYEWNDMSAARSTATSRLLSWIGLAATLAAMVLGFPALTCLIVMAVAFIVIAAQSAFAGGGQWPTFGLVYAASSAIAMTFLRGTEWHGLIAILFLFAVVWATDILAYFVGRAVGGPKLAPSISPGKTRSGAIGGAVGGVFAGVALVLIAGTGSAGTLALIALLLSIVAQAGDLLESWVKRRHGVKDSGRLIPGHGGVMDRVDGLVTAAMALYLAGAIVSGLDSPAAGLFGG